MSKLDILMLELFDGEAKWEGSDFVFTDRGREIIDKISDYAERTRIFQEHKERGEMFDAYTAKQVFGYLLDRIVNAPTMLHRDASILLIMPFVRQKLKEEAGRNDLA